jgi:hypothetical protein
MALQTAGRKLAMKMLGIVLLISALAQPACGVKRVTAESFERSLDKVHGKSDAEAAKRLGEFQLSERLSEARFARIQAGFPGPLSRRALVALADAADFLDLPASDIPATPAPNLDEQKAILARAFDYARQAIPKLPNFFATCETTRFEDTPTGPHWLARCFVPVDC